jgi:ABC-2 type transport system ATP-binding protein
VFEVLSLVKRFAGVHVLRDVSFHVTRGEILGYLGPNGSGKSTTFRIIAGLLDATEGHLVLDGRRADDDAPGFRRRLGYVPDEPHLYTHLTAPEYLRLVGRLRSLPVPRLERHIATVLDLLDLSASSGGAMTAFSKGMRQRVLLAAALLHDPDVLVLDEPFSGLDVDAAILLRALIRALAARGKMILMSSHRLDVVEELCSRVIILHRGRIVAQGQSAELRATRFSGSLEDVFTAVTEQKDYAARVNAILEATTRP